MTPTNKLFLYSNTEEMLKALQEKDPEIENIPGRTILTHRYGVWLENEWNTELPN